MSKLSMGNLRVLGSLIRSMLIVHFGVILSAFLLSVISTLDSVSWQYCAFSSSEILHVFFIRLVKSSTFSVSVLAVISVPFWSSLSVGMVFFFPPDRQLIFLQNFLLHFAANSTRSICCSHHSYLHWFPSCIKGTV